MNFNYKYLNTFWKNSTEKKFLRGGMIKKFVSRLEGTVRDVLSISSQNLPDQTRRLSLRVKTRKFISTG